MLFTHNELDHTKMEEQAGIQINNIGIKKNLCNNMANK